MKLALEKLVAEQITWEKKRALCNTRELKEKNNILHSVEKKTTSRPHAYGKILEVYLTYILSHCIKILIHLWETFCPYTKSLKFLF